MTYVLDLQEDENGDVFIVFPEELMEGLDWHEGDLLNWDLRGNGIVLTKVNDPSDYEVIEG